MKLSTPYRRQLGQRGYMLLSVMLLITLMIIAMAVEIPRIAQQIKRANEEELEFRGREYATAIKKFYHRNGTYPVSLEQLENTNNLRFLRKRYKDPMTQDGEWRLIHVGEAEIKLQNPAQAGLTATPTPAGNTSGFGASGNAGLSGGTTSGGSGQGFGTPAGQSGSGQGFGTPAGQMGTLNTQGTGPGLGGSGGGAGGPIIGVASQSKKTGIKEHNGEDEYDRWLFVYDPRAEQSGNGGIFIASPRAAASPTGTPQPGAPPPPPPPAGGPPPQQTPTPNPSMPQ
jgi:type II secretory pathway pseudopilin PulG